MAPGHNGVMMSHIQQTVEFVYKNWYREYGLSESNVFGYCDDIHAVVKLFAKGVDGPVVHMVSWDTWSKYSFDPWTDDSYVLWKSEEVQRWMREEYVPDELEPIVPLQRGMPSIFEKFPDVKNDLYRSSDLAETVGCLVRFHSEHNLYEVAATSLNSHVVKLIVETELEAGNECCRIREDGRVEDYGLR